MNELCNTGNFLKYFHRIKRLGSGKLWEIWEVIEVNGGKTFAVKIVKFNYYKVGPLFSLHDIKKIILLQQREVAALANLPAHPNIMKYIAHWLEERIDFKNAQIISDSA